MNAGRSQTLLFLWRVGKNYSDILMLRDTQMDVRLRLSKLAPDHYFQQCGRIAAIALWPGPQQWTLRPYPGGMVTGP